jgi:hypothetical protein
MTLLWLDDVRPAPEGWKWAKTAEEARQILLQGDVTQCSLDHDLGSYGVQDPDDWDEIIENYDENAETGFDLVTWMIEMDLVPRDITIHSWNPDGAHRMAMRFLDHGYECTLAPFKA